MRGLERLILLVILTALPAQAEWITIQVEGVVDSVTDNGNYLEGNVNFGDTFTGWYTYDTETLDTDASHDFHGLYRHYSAPAGVSINLNDFVFETDFDNINFEMVMLNNFSPIPDDAYSFISYNNIPLVNMTPVNKISWRLGDDTMSALSSDVLPASPPNLDQWQTNHLIIESFDNFIIDAHVISAIPEPATTLLLAIGALGFFSRKTSGN